jgi:altronate hydrolase
MNQINEEALLKLAPIDNVGVARYTIFLDENACNEAGVDISKPVDENVINTAKDGFLVPQAHKVALCDIKQGENIIKYGYPIGHATSDIKKGEWVHVHNCKTNLNSTLEYDWHPENATKYAFQNVPGASTSFKGFRRPWLGKTAQNEEQVGIRNDLLVLPMVGCLNGIATQIVRESGVESDSQPVTVLSHPYGCSQLGGDHKATQQILADAAIHPNFGGVLVFGLGCENNTIASFRQVLSEKYVQNGTTLEEVEASGRIKFLIAQSVDDEVEEGAKLLQNLADLMKNDVRNDVPISQLRVGLKCGGSDGFSGVTANPLLGHFSDWLVSQGGSTILTEVPEMFGAEQILMDRAKDESTFEEVVSLINNFKKYFEDFGEPVYENPSPGNKNGGITTLEDKSLGCTQKSGTSPVNDVILYGDRLAEAGLSLLQSPGNDLVASSALASAGCHIVLFTTGRGTPFGTFVPTAKIATNKQLAQKKMGWIDFNAGVLLDRSFEEVLPEFIDFVVSTVDGNLTRNEQHNDREIAIFKNGVTL